MRYQTALRPEPAILTYQPYLTWQLAWFCHAVQHSPSWFVSRPSLRKPAAIAAVAVIICVAVLAAALWEQAQGNAPCPLCVLQRLGYLSVMAFSLLGVVGALAQRARATRLALALAALSGLGGLSVAFKHLWLVWHPGQTCGLDPLAVQINHWAITGLAPWLFRADGFCADVPYLFGMSLPGWSALGFAVLVLALLLALRMTPRPIR